MCQDGSRVDPRRNAPLNSMHTLEAIMTTDLLTATELVTILTVFSAVFCPLLCWSVSGTLPQYVSQRLQKS